MILAIETSCDETAVAVTSGRKVLSNIVKSQIDIHAKFGGVVPEVASRHHAECIAQLTKLALNEAKISFEDISAVAVTYAPGLIGALLVGVNFAKSLAFSLNVPLVPVHHLRGHVASCYIDSNLKPPFVALAASGGHSHILCVDDYITYKILGRTLDDAAGECFDKSARSLGLAYPGGINLDKLADFGNAENFVLPTPKSGDGAYDMSFSGLKTAVVNIIHNLTQKGEELSEGQKSDMAASIRKKICDILIDNSIRAVVDSGLKRFAICGGVATNSELRSRIELECDSLNIECFVPQLKYCGDNAAMVGVQAFCELEKGGIASANLNGFATMSVEIPTF